MEFMEEFLGQFHIEELIGFGGFERRGEQTSQEGIDAPFVHQTFSSEKGLEIQR